MNERGEEKKGKGVGGIWDMASPLWALSNKWALSLPLLIQGKCS